MWMAQSKRETSIRKCARLDVCGSESEEDAHVELECRRGGGAECTRVVRVAEEVRELRALLAQVTHALDAESAQHLLSDRPDAADLRSTRERVVICT